MSSTCVTTISMVANSSTLRRAMTGSTPSFCVAVTKVFLQDLSRNHAVAARVTLAVEPKCLPLLARFVGIIGVDQDVRVEEATAAHESVRGRSANSHDCRALDLTNAPPRQ